MEPQPIIPWAKHKNWHYISYPRKQLSVKMTSQFPPFCLSDGVRPSITFSAHTSKHIYLCIAIQTSSRYISYCLTNPWPSAIISIVFSVFFFRIWATRGGSFVAAMKVGGDDTLDGAHSFWGNLILFALQVWVVQGRVVKGWVVQVRVVQGLWQKPWWYRDCCYRYKWYMAGWYRCVLVYRRYRPAWMNCKSRWAASGQCTPP